GRRTPRRRGRRPARRPASGRVRAGRPMTAPPGTRAAPSAGGAARPGAPAGGPAAPSSPPAHLQGDRRVLPGSGGEAPFRCSATPSGPGPLLFPGPGHPPRTRRRGRWAGQKQQAGGNVVVAPMTVSSGSPSLPGPRRREPPARVGRGRENDDTPEFSAGGRGAWERPGRRDERKTPTRPVSVHPSIAEV